MKNTPEPQPAHIELNRFFTEWTKKSVGDSEELARMLGAEHSLKWPDLLALRRVVVLAEAGSGKSSEFLQQAQELQASGRMGFHATLQNVGTAGLEQALGSAQQAAFKSWQAGTEEGWFFLDSIDEAKDARVKFDEALKHVATGIAGGQGRAHIILSGRHTEWEAGGDLARFKERLPVPPPDTPVEPIDSDILLVQTIRREKVRETPAAEESAVVVVMAALDREQVERFVRGKGVSDVDAFLGALGRNDLWRFARRPLDLEWLVDHWRLHGTFGTLSQMLEESLRQRLREPDRQRARQDSLTVERSLEALERIGAALVLQKLQYVKVPDTVLDLGESRAGLDLRELLPEWSDEHLVRLMSRAVFDPVVAGLVRLHNDNEGEIRSYLTARWLARLLKNGCPHPAVFDLLFASVYGEELVIPSMRQSAAWLAVFDEDTAREILRREPQLLMSAGDPGSLPLATREKVLDTLVSQPAEGKRPGASSFDHLQRFSRADLVPRLRMHWQEHKDALGTRLLLLQMIWLGELRQCADLALEATLGTAFDDTRTLMFAGRAVLATAEGRGRLQYARHLIENAPTLPPIMVWEGIEGLFPGEISVTQLLQLLGRIDLTGPYSQLDRMATSLVDRLQSLPALEQLGACLVSLSRQHERTGVDVDDPLEEAINAVAVRILKLLPVEQSSTLALEAYLKDSERRPHRKPDEILRQRVHASTSRRRAMFWHAVAKLANASALRGEALADLWKLRMLGYRPPLEVEDAEWLLTDAATRAAPSERQLAADAVMVMVREKKVGEEAASRLRMIVGSHSEIATVIETWEAPRTASREERESERELKKLHRRNSVHQAEVEESWVRFARDLRENPGQLREIGPPRDNAVDTRLYHLWKLLSSVGENRRRYAIDTLTVLEPLFPTPVLDALRDAFIRFWRAWKPTLHSERAVGERNVISEFDCIGIVGVTLEASNSPQWARGLTHEEAVRAAAYGTVELNGLPKWFTDLALAQPAAVRVVLEKEIAADLDGGSSDATVNTLQDLEYAQVPVKRVVAPALFAILEDPRHLREEALVIRLLEILASSGEEPERLKKVLERAIGRGSATPAVLGVYFEFLFRLAPGDAAWLLTRKLKTLGLSQRKVLARAVLSRLVGDHRHDKTDVLAELPFNVLLQWVEIAFETVRIEDDNPHPDGQMYSPDARDRAEHARSALFKTLVETPGAATYQALKRFMRRKDFGIKPERLAVFAQERAGEDAEHAAWMSSDVSGFEKDYTTLPRSALDLQRVAIQRLQEMQHTLRHADFGEGGATLARQPDEAAVQSWVAGYLRERQGRSYSVEREPRVVHEKAPDARFRAKASDASVAMEIKVMESWPLPQLEEALRDQLVGRYLRDWNHRHGILLLVHQRGRGKGWRNVSGGWLNAGEVYAHLLKIADRIASRSPQSPQPKVVWVDVSASAATKRAAKKNRAGTAAKSSRSSTKKTRVVRAKKKRPAKRAARPSALKPRSGRKRTARRK